MIFIKIFFNYILLQVVTSIPIYTLYIFNKNSFAYYLIAILAVIVQITYILFENKNYGLKLFNFKGALKYTKIIIYGTILILINELIFIFLENEKIIKSNSSITFETLFTGHNILLYIYILIIAPILEEIFFRGIFYNLSIPSFNKFKDKNKKIIINSKMYLIILINAAIFSYVHSDKIGISSIYYFIGGIILSICYLKSKNLKVPIFLHSINNLISVII